MEKENHLKQGKKPVGEGEDGTKRANKMAH